MKFYSHLGKKSFIEDYLSWSNFLYDIFSYLNFKVTKLGEELELLYQDSLINILTPERLEALEKQHIECHNLVWAAINSKLIQSPNEMILEVNSKMDYQCALNFELIKMQKSEKSQYLVLYLMGKDLLEQSQKNIKSSDNSVNDLMTWISIFNTECAFFDSIYNDLTTRITNNKGFDAYLSERNSRAALKRHEPSRKTKEYAIKLYLKTNNQKSVKQAVRYFYNDVITYGKSNGFDFTDDIQAFDTIYKWVLAYKKALK